MKKVIYTANIGGFDDIVDQTKFPGWELVMFTDQIPEIESKLNSWTFRKADLSKGKTESLVNRWYKMHPHVIFPDHDLSIYIDSNIQIHRIDFIERSIDQFMSRGINIAVTDHLMRDCVYKEAKAIINTLKDSPKSVDQTMKILKNDGYPIDNDLFENNVLFRVHNDPEIISLMESWWDFINTHSPRDQLSLCYLLWKLNIRAEKLLGEGYSTRNHPDLSFYEEHKKEKLNNLLKKKTLRYKTLYFITSLIPVRKLRKHYRFKLKI